jgi:hypothetical protein
MGWGLTEVRLLIPTASETEGKGTLSVLVAGECHEKLRTVLRDNLIPRKHVFECQLEESQDGRISLHSFTSAPNPLVFGFFGDSGLNDFRPFPVILRCPLCIRTIWQSGLSFA